MDILKACARLERAGLIAGTSGNVSVKRSGEVIVTTPTTRLKESLREEELVPLSRSGEKLVRGGLSPSSEIAMHLAIYDVADWAGAVVHAHPVHATALANTSGVLDFCVTAEGAASIGPIVRAPYIRPGTEALGEACARGVALGARAILMRHHGAVCVGESLDEALARMESLEHVAKIVCAMRALGEVALLPEDEVAALRSKVGLDSGLPRWVHDLEP